MKLKDSSGEYPNFEEFSKIMTHIASEVDDPVYGNEKYYTKNQTISETQKAPHAALQATISTPWRNKCSSTSTCILCNDENHKLYQCGTFKDMTPGERLKFVSRNNLRFNCFYCNHRAAACRLKSMCDVAGCKYKHSRLLHMYEKSDKDSTEVSP